MTGQANDEVHCLTMEYFLKWSKYATNEVGKNIFCKTEELKKRAVEYIRDNISMKNCPNLTTVTICKRANKGFLLNCTLQPGFHENFVSRWLVSGPIFLVLRF